jgi:hypothetical protein
MNSMPPIIALKSRAAALLDRLNPEQRKIAAGFGVIFLIVASLTLLGALLPDSRDPVMDARIDAQMWLKRTAHDPSSIEIVSADAMRSDSTNELLLCVQYRGRNAFGARVSATKLFLFRDGKIIEVSDFPR